MPLININMKKGHSAEYKKTFLQAVHDSLAQVLGIPKEDRFQRLNEFEPDFFETAPDKSDNFCIIEITMFPGRTKEQKKCVIETITETLNNRLNIRPEDIFILIQEPPLENWGMRGQQLK